MKVFDFIKDKIKLNNTPKKRLFLKQLSLLCAIVAMFICVVWAWFASVEPATATGASIKMTAGSSMSISLDSGQNFVGGIDLLSDDDQQYIGESNKIINSEGDFLLSMQDITSDGKEFFRPKFTEENGQRIPNTDENWDYATKNRAYISQEIIFRTNSSCDIIMGGGTKIITSCEDEDKAFVSDTPENIGNKSKSGNFSNDCIVGALRISAIDNMDTNKPCKFVCIPRPDFELVRNGTDVTMYTGNNVSDETTLHTYYDSTYQTSGEPVTSLEAITEFDGTQVITTTEYNEETGFYEAKATVNLWLEGCDPEVTRMLSGGKYNIIFNFIAVEK